MVEDSIIVQKITAPTAWLKKLVFQEDKSIVFANDKVVSV